jgi:hypothetical protein
MLDQKAAMDIAEEHLRKLSERSGMNLCLIESPVLQGDWGWVFGYSTTEHLRTKSINSAPGGNAPLLVDKTTGAVTTLGTAFPIEHYVERHIEFGDPHAVPSGKVELLGHKSELIRPPEIIKKIRSDCGIGLGEASWIFQECIAGRPQTLEMENADLAQALVRDLGFLGILAKRLPA